MAQTPFIHMSCKRTDEVDWNTPLKSYIELNYQDDSSKYQEELANFHRMRQDMRGAGLDSTGRDLLYRYYGQLDLLDLRFPIDENNIRVSFSWYDIFTQKAVSQFSLAYEKACVIFNIAAVVSAMGTSQNRTEVLGLKQAFHYLQASAGIYSYINENFLHAPTSDLNRENIKLLVQIMLAQAQECFIEKCLLEKKKSNLISKLASQATYLYSNISDSMSEGLAKDSFPSSCQFLVQAKYKYYYSLAHYHKAIALEEATGYGEAVSRLTVAETLAKEAINLSILAARTFGHSKSIVYPADAGTSFAEITKLNHEAILEKRDSAIKDNEFVYHDIVTKAEILTPIEKLSAANTISFSELFSPADMTKVIGPDVFSKLIPLSVHESSSMYSEEKAKIIRKEAERVELTNVELDTSLSYLDLPQSLAKYKNNSSVSLQSLTEPPQEIRQISSGIFQTEVNMGSLLENISSLKVLNSSLRKTLEDATTLLLNDGQNFESYHGKYNGSWKQEHPSTATNKFRIDVSKNLEILDSAAKSDDASLEKYFKAKSELEVLASNPDSDELGKYFAETIISASTTSNSSSTNILSLVEVEKEDTLEGVVAEVEDCLDRLETLRKERLTVLQDLKEKSQSDDISSILVLNKKLASVEPQIFSNELEKYRGHQNRITSTVHHQQAILQELTAAVQKLLASNEGRFISQGWDLASQAKNQIVHKLQNASNLYKELCANYKNGKEFYTKQKANIAELYEKVQSVVTERRRESDNLVEVIENARRNNNNEQARPQPQSHEGVNYTPTAPTAPPALLNNSTYELISDFQNMSLRQESSHQNQTYSNSNYPKAIPSTIPQQPAFNHYNTYSSPEVPQPSSTQSTSISAPRYNTQPYQPPQAQVYHSNSSTGYNSGMNFKDGSVPLYEPQVHTPPPNWNYTSRPTQQHVPAPSHYTPYSSQPPSHTGPMYNQALSPPSTLQHGSYPQLSHSQQSGPYHQPPSHSQNLIHGPPVPPNPYQAETNYYNRPPPPPPQQQQQSQLDYNYPNQHYRPQSYYPYPPRS